MKVRNYLENIAGVGIYPIITLLLFFSVFIISLIWVMRTRKQQFTEAGNLPFNSGELTVTDPSNI